MESFHWNNNFITGLENVDHQHRHLVDMVNHFGEQLAQNEINSDDLEPLLSELASYAQYHFDEEESLMASIGVDPLHTEAHMLEHRNFFEEVNLMLSGVSPDNPSALKHLLDFLTHWLAYHILGSDQNMARQIERIRHGMSPTEAYETEERERDAATEPLLVALNALFQQVSTRNRELVQLNQSLEQKVAERTQALSEANQHLEEIALTDLLTNLPNRRHAMRQLGTLWNESTAAGTALTCMMIDADHFKEVNDTWGHDAGDEVLVELSRCLRHSMRNDDVVCRLGGDEFFVICPNTDLKGAMHIAEITRENVENLSVKTGDGHWNSSISVGVATRNSEMADLEALMKAADESVYLAKRAGKNCVRTVSR